ncbi:M48 family metalloprotease [Dechloromonas sp. HYN0024]|uniref:M48 family metalloprotease n=1 Tax=Dechloromonas sp. HYN0024 TaxID=2231055 RepID=UPI000E44EC99|nr:M48 family metalloprotease [Dechloromonas sp. HYN0024]AXS80624.1 hypothetical protein HYN24_11695 [Dechloromonas sp. HYN0024]
MRAALLVVLMTLIAISGVSAQSNPLFWSIQDEQAFSTRHMLNGPNGLSIVLPGRSLVALAEAKRKIGDQYGLQPLLVITNQPGINAFATEINGKSIVAVNVDTILAIRDDADMWAALMGHEFGHVYHNHVANHQARASIIGLAAQVLDAYQQRHGRNRTELINFGAQLVDNTFTRDQEREADASSIEFMTRAGYNPDGAIRLQQLLISNYGSAGALAFLQSHPSGEERIQNLQAKITATSRSAFSDSSISVVEFRRYIAICGGEAKEAGVENSKVFATQFACLKKQNPEIAKRFALCANDLASGKRLNPDSMSSCVSNGDTGTNQFGYAPWVAYCGLDARNEGGSDATIVFNFNKCIWTNASPTALQGYLCEAEAAQLRVPAENRATALRNCSRETVELKARFDRSIWELACKRKGTTTSTIRTEQENLERECLAAGPAKVNSVLGANKGAISPPQLLAEVRDAWSKLSVPASITPNECDQLATTVAIGDIKAHPVGFIDSIAAEPICMTSAKNPKDNGRAMVSLAAIYLQQGRYAEAAEWANKAKAKNALNAGTVLAVLYINGFGGYAIDYSKAHALLLSEAKRGSADAICDLASHIREGRGIEAQPEISFELLKLAADRGDAPAMAALANLYSSGKGVPLDKAEAMRLLRIAAPNFPQSNLSLIAALRNSPNVDKDELRQVQTRALEVAKRYADMGSQYAKMMLATIYANGLGVPVDRGRAIDIYKELASRDSVSALMALGFAHLNGAGVPQDKDQAIGYFKRAAAHGNKDAEIQIARAQAR